MCVEGSLCLFVLVRGQIVGSEAPNAIGPGEWAEHRAGFNLGDQHVSDECDEGWTIHRPFDDPGCDQIGWTEPRNQGLGSPRSKGRRCCQVPTAQRPPGQACQVGFDRCFINKHDALGPGTDRGNTMGEPIGPGALYSRAFVLLRAEAFLYVYPSRLSAGSMSETDTSCASDTAPCNSLSVMSGSCWINSIRNSW